jgi:myo-inositol-1(or 4)-monophosphatase
MGSMMDLKNIERQLIDTCKEVSQFIRKEGSAFDRSRIEQKQGDFNNLVSYVDKEAEKKLVTALKKIFPAAGYITEEGTVEQSGQKEFNWIIDPLDGTTNFLHGLPLFAISVALVHQKQPVVGVVHNIIPDECFHAVKGGKAFCNDKEIRVTAIGHLRESLLATGFPYYHLDKSEVYLDIIKDFLAKTHGIRRLGSAAIDLAYVACGRLEGFFEYNLNPWDVAAGALIVQEAGGSVTDFKGEDNYLFGGQMCASNTSIHAEMLGVIKPQWGY